MNNKINCDVCNKKYIALEITKEFRYNLYGYTITINVCKNCKQNIRLKTELT